MSGLIYDLSHRRDLSHRHDLDMILSHRRQRKMLNFSSEF